jgi:hypothetical protein
MRSLVRLSIPIVLIALIALAPTCVVAQTPAQPAAPEAQAAAPLKLEQLEQLAAPIALYPDPLLTQVLMAATYPLEVVAADRFVTANKNLKPEELKAQAEKKNWDKSVVALVATPDVLKMMSDKLDWTQQIGDALLAQQADLMDAIQKLRGRAKAQNKLATTKQQVVSTRQEQGKEVIVIEPAEPETIYVPYYDPAVVYGAWPYAAYPPYLFPWPGYIGRGIIAAGIGFGAGWALGRWTSGGNYWGGSVNWGNNNININRPINIADRDRVQHFNHNPAHRHGVKYPQQLQNKFANRPGAGDAGQRIDFRGRDGQQVLRPDQGGPGRDRPGAGDRPGGGDRPGAGQRPGGGDRPGAGAGQRPGGDRPGAGQRPAGGDRPGAGGRPGGDRPSAGPRPGGDRPSAGQRPAQRPGGGGGRGGGAFADIDRGGGAARAAAQRGHASFGGGGRGGGGGHFAGGGGGRGGGGFSGGGGGRGGGGGGGRRSDIALKHDVMLLGHLDNGLAYYRFAYIGSERTYVGVMAQEVQSVRPDAVARGRDGYLRVHYGKLGVKFQTYEQWTADGARVPVGIRAAH